MQGKNQPAFPWCGDLNECPTINLGMSLRDYFAAKALPEVYSRVTSGGFERVAQLSYELADAMLKARQEPQE